jgi:hypothetical protein
MSRTETTPKGEAGWLKKNPDPFKAGVITLQRY